MKTCSKCGIPQALDEFALKNPKTGTRSAWCRTCNRAYQKEHYTNNRDVYRTKARTYERDHGGKLGKRLRAHNLTDEVFQELLDRHKGKCWMGCGRNGTDIDHDHECCPGATSCGKCIRGILCNPCNLGLGLLGDTRESLKKALNYLTQ